MACSLLAPPRHPLTLTHARGRRRPYSWRRATPNVCCFTSPGVPRLAAAPDRALHNLCRRSGHHHDLHRPRDNHDDHGTADDHDDHGTADHDDVHDHARDDDDPSHDDHNHSSDHHDDRGQVVFEYLGLGVGASRCRDPSRHRAGGPPDVAHETSGSRRQLGATDDPSGHCGGVGARPRPLASTDGRRRTKSKRDRAGRRRYHQPRARRKLRSRRTSCRRLHKVRREPARPCFCRRSRPPPSFGWRASDRCTARGRRRCPTQPRR